MRNFQIRCKDNKKIYNCVCVNSFCSLFNNYEIILIANNLAYLKGCKRTRLVTAF